MRNPVLADKHIVKLGAGEAGGRRGKTFVHADLAVLQNNKICRFKLKKTEIRVLVQSPVKGELLGL